MIPVFNPGHVLTWRHVVAYLLLAGNWSVIAWGWPLHSIITPLWTVSIEEQFYLAWPPLVRRLSRNHIAWAAVVMLLIATATRIAMVAIHGNMNSAWCNTLCRLDPIAAGILIAVVLHGSLPEFPTAARLALFVCGVASLVFVANHWAIHEPVRLEWVPTLAGFPLVAAGCTLIVLSALGSRLPLPRPLIYLGKISYGLYVYHPLGNVLSGMLIPVHSAFLQLALRPITALAVTILLASASYALLEKPFLKLKNRFAHISSRPV
jgi:peptidoglycan/LPS O-acetylase OafA/YrhL